MPTPKSKCQNCDEVFEDDELGVIKDIFERVEAGEPMPSGECPECGCLCHYEFQVENAEELKTELVKLQYQLWDAKYRTESIQEVLAKPASKLDARLTKLAKDLLLACDSAVNAVNIAEDPTDDWVKK